jgi:hypothetical protein
MQQAAQPEAASTGIIITVHARNEWCFWFVDGSESDYMVMESG